MPTRLESLQLAVSAAIHDLKTGAKSDTLDLQRLCKELAQELTKALKASRRTEG